ncbi:MAG: hypothetical protein GC191_05590 [Azospirillum sp.]|nr:hypothetical protein [Azospirillum sp.]
MVYELFSAAARDALAEIFNIGIGRAAAVLSRRVGSEVAFDSPALDLVASAQLPGLIAQRCGAAVVSLSRSFDGRFDGKASLILPENAAAVLAAALAPTAEAEGRESDRLLEIGIIVVGACIDSLAELLETEIALATPVRRTGDPAPVAVGVATADDFELLCFSIDFQIVGDPLLGYLVLGLDPPSALALLSAVEDLTHAFSDP